VSHVKESGLRQGPNWDKGHSCRWLWFTNSHTECQKWHSCGWRAN